MQSMDMILIRKKRIAIAKKQSSEKVNNHSKKKGIWEMLSSVGTNRNQESKRQKKFFCIKLKCIF